MSWLRDLLLGKGEAPAPRYGAAQEEPDPVDWSAVEDQLVEASELCIIAFGEKHRTESFYGLGFDCNSSEGQILICLNTRELQECASRQVTAPYDTLGLSEEQRLASAEWGFGEWGYHGINLRQRHWSRSWRPIGAMISQGIEMLSMNRRYEAMRTWEESFMLMASRALLRVASGGAVEGLRRDPDFKVLCMNHDESPEDGFRRLSALGGAAP